MFNLPHQTWTYSRGTVTAKRISHGVCQLVLNEVRRKAENLVQNGSGSSPEAVAAHLFFT